MRSRIRIEGELLTEARIAAAESGLTLSRYVEEAIRRQIDDGPCPDVMESPDYMIHDADEEAHEVELSESGELLELMEST